LGYANISITETYTSMSAKAENTVLNMSVRLSMSKQVRFFIFLYQK